MNTIDRFKTTVKKAKSLDGLELHRIYRTKNYGIINNRAGNRNGTQEPRVQLYVQKINSNTFLPIEGAVSIDQNGVIIDGHHRYEALKRCGKEIFFRVSDEFSRDINPLDAIAMYNSSKSSAWKNSDNFKSALSLDAPLALVLNALRLKAMSDNGLTEAQMNVGDMYAILTQNNKFFGAGVHTVTREMYYNQALAAKAKGIEYQMIISDYAYIRKHFAKESKAYKICKAIVQCTFPDNGRMNGFNLNVFRNNLSLVKFMIVDGTTNDFANYAFNVHNRYALKLATKVK